MFQSLVAMAISMRQADDNTELSEQQKLVLILKLEEARQEYTRYLQATHPAEVTKSGLVIDADDPCLACSPDGKVAIRGTQQSCGLVEFKCPYSAAEYAPIEAANLLPASWTLTVDPCNLIDPTTTTIKYKVN